MPRFNSACVLGLLLAGSPLNAASTWSGNPTEYRPVETNEPQPALEALRQRALSGQLTTDDVLRAAAEIKAVHENTPAAPAAASPDTIPVPSVQSQPEPLVYTRAATSLQIPVDDSSQPLHPAERKELVQDLNAFPLKDLLLVKGIHIAPVMNDPNLGHLVVQTQGGQIALYGTADIKEALEGGTAAVVYDSLRGSPLQDEWDALGDFSDFVQSFTAWMDNTTQAFEEAEQPEAPPKELSQLFFMAALFSDPSSARSVIYNPSAQPVTWQMQGDHYGFGPYTFDVSHHEIIHVAYNGAPLGPSAAAIPSQWAVQGLGN